ncbi:hypothetical protein B566_EDAN006460 [Ephemera danica]|nr:hypothetical protein B566_EDAN006460 [Ephemera danica]
MCLLIGTVLLLVFASTTLAVEERPLITTKLGSVRGAWQTSAGGRRYAAFMAVPYAKPPVGALRFEPPEPIDSWDGEWDAGQLPSPCMCYSQLFGPEDTQRIKGQEDCLYLNIYTPKFKSKEILPVLVYIHGGAFMFGGSDSYGAKYMMDRDVIFVTINYRLGPLGFLSLEDDVQPGNNGMRDQVAALEWVQRHIAEFGGDPQQVTIIGVSAGGASVHYHYLSPLSKGLFQRGISMSGTALSRWALADGARQKALQLAASVGCPTDQGSQRLMKCLKSRPSERILMHVEQFQVWQYSPFSPFAPVVERPNQSIPAFLPEAPSSALARGAIQRLPWVTGVTSAEGLYPVAAFIACESELERLDQEFNFLVPHLLHFNFTVKPGTQDKVAQLVRKEYFGDKPVNDATVPQVIKMASDRLFMMDSQRSAELQSRHSPVYFYLFDYRGATSLSDLMSDTTKDFGVSHADDMFYFMNTSYAPVVERTGMDKLIETLEVDLWTNFVAKGIPEAKSAPKWEPVTPGGDLEFLHIKSVPPAMSKVEDLGNAAFWESLPLLEEAQSVTQSPSQKREL